MKIIKKYLLILILVAACDYSAQELSGIPGAFVDVGFGARPVSMGGAYTAFASDVHSIVWNPAGLSRLKKSQASFNYVNQLGLVDYYYMSAAMPLSPESRSAAGILVISSGDKALREWTFGTAYSKEIWGFLMGVGVKVRYATFGNNTLSKTDLIIFEQDEIDAGLGNQVFGSALGFGVDVGFLFDLSERVALGISFRDMMSSLSWDSDNKNSDIKPKGKYSEALPTEAYIGLAFKVLDELSIAADYSPGFIQDANPKLFAGAEGVLFKILYLRAGTQYYINSVQDEKFTLGLGLDINALPDMTIKTDFGYLIERLDNTVRFTLGLEF